MKIVAVTNRKGGVGKSTFATHIAAGLARKGHRVGIADTDSQGHAALMLGVPEENGLFHLLIDKAPLKEVVRQIPVENYSDVETSGMLLLIPSSNRTYQIPHMLKPDETFLFLEKLQELGDLAQLDYIIIDTHPTMSLFDGSMYLAADGFVYITECEHLSMSGVREAFDQLRSFERQRKMYMNRDTRILGIIPNKFRNTIIHQENLAQLRETFGALVWDEIPLRTIWTEASNFHQPVFTYAPNEKATEDAWTVVDRIEGELEQWETDEIA